MSNLSDFLNKKLSDPILTLSGTEGTPGQVPISQGPDLPPVWGLPASADFQEFTSSGTWTKPDDVNFVAVHIVAGGGGGSTNVGACGGEGLFMVLPASELGATESVVVGAGGTSNPTSGGDSSFAGITAVGGRQGQNVTALTLRYANTTSATNVVATVQGTGGDLSGFGCASGIAGNSIYGGGGGTGADTRTGGLSRFAGDGGIALEDGYFPGGGGGRAAAGAAGVVRVWSW